MQTVIYDAAVKLAKILAPILPHTMGEVWGYLKEKEEDVYLSNFPEIEDYADADDLKESWGEFMKLRDDVLKALEEARDQKLIGKSFEASVTVYPGEAAKAALDKLAGEDFREILIVSNLVMGQGEVPAEAKQFDQASVLVRRAEGEVCPRCRMYRTDLGTDSRLPQLCGRCASIVAGDHPEILEEGLED